MIIPMKTNMFTLIFALYFVQCVSAQTYSLKKEAQLEEVQAFIDSLRPSSKVALSLNFNANDLHGKAAMDKKHYQKQLVETEAQLKTDPNNGAVWADYISSYMQLYPNDTAKINELLEQHQQRLLQLIEQKPNEARNHYYLSLLYAMRTEPEKAHSAASRAAEIAPDSSRYKVNLAFRLKEMGEFKIAKALYGEVLEKDAQNLDALIFLFLTDFFMKMSDSQDIDMSRLQIDNSHIKSAYQNYPTQVIGLLLQSSELMNILYKTLFATIINSDNDQETKKAMKNLSSKDPQLANIKKYFLDYHKNTKGDKSYPAYVLSLIHFLEGSLKLAYSYGEEAIKLSPERTDFYDNLVFMYVSQEEYAKALKLTQQKMQVKATAADYMVMAKIHSELGSKEKRMETLLKGLEYFPQDADLLFYVFLIVFEAKEYEKAKDYLTRSLTSSSENADAISAYGALELLSGNTQEGFNALHFAKEKSDAAEAVFNFYFVED